MKPRQGFRHIYTLKEGEQWAHFEGKIVIIHPERPPMTIDVDGKVTPLPLEDMLP